MSQDKSVSEPSMEEILSSIRRIIADEDKVPPTAAAGTPATEDEVLELTTVAEDDAESGPAPATVPGPPPTGEPSLPPAASKTSRDEKEATTASGEPLLSPAAAAASMSAFAKLARPSASESPPVTAGITVEALVVQLLRPALREWLDANLPPLVERIVEQEVRKLARRAEIQ